MAEPPSRGVHSPAAQSPPPPRGPRPIEEGDARTRRLPLERSPRGADDVEFLAAEDDEVKVRLRVEADGSLTILALAPRTPLADKLLDGVRPDEIRTELCG